MRRFLAVAAAVFVLVFLQTAEAQMKPTSTARIRLVHAQCTTGPCVSAFDFARGDVQIRRVKMPKPVNDRRFGRIKISGLDAGLGTFPSGLEARISGRRIFGSDPDGDCPMANTETTGDFGFSNLECKLSAFNVGRCLGTLVFNGLLPPQCSDVRQTIQDLNVSVYLQGMVGNPAGLLATLGVGVVGKVPDCDSGGSGC
jgi:hypothetical protein